MTAVVDQREVVLRARGIDKRYGGTHALRGVDFEARAGAVTTLLGENGAGKSTLMKILAGIEKPTSGTVELHGKEVEFDSADDALDAGIAIIHQELNLAPNLSVADNIFLGRELRTRFGTVDYRAQRRRARELLALLEEDIDPKTLVSNLRLGQQQIVEIASALATDARVLIMDEPTSALSASEVEVLFRVIKELTAKGVAIIYISHHLEEALHLADYVVVLRDGAVVGHSPADEIDIAWVIGKMVGHSEMPTHVPNTELGETLLEVDELRVVDPQFPGRNVVDGVSLEVRAGEIVCIYGLMGSGRTELMEAIAGRVPVVDGHVLLRGEDVTEFSIRERVEAGLGLVPEDRQRDGLIQTQSVSQNMTLASISRAVRGPFLSRSREAEAVRAGIGYTHVKAASPNISITSLSGGNQQKVVISKLLLTDPSVLLLDEPTRGIDVGAKGEIFTLLAEQAHKGMGVLFVSSEISEALTSCDRLIVMSHGRITGEFAAATADREAVMTAAGENVAVVEEERHHDRLAKTQDGATK